MKNIKIPIFMYHEILDDNEKDPKVLSLMQSSYFVKKSVFEKQMGFLHEQGFKPISLYEVTDYLDKKDGFRMADKCLVITFDDGYMGNYKYAFPILKKFGFTATVFCTVKLIGEPYMMGWEELKFLSQNGISIQSHTLSHPFLGQLNDEQVNIELKSSKNILESKLGARVDYISLPHGSNGKNYKQIASSLGFLGGCSSIAGLNDISVDRFFLRRILISGSYSLNKFKSIVLGRRSSILSIKFDKFMKTLGKKIMGEKVYYRIYNIIFRLKK